MMMYASHRPDLIILDLGLPDRDGLDLIREVRKSDALPIIVLSARSNERDKVEALDLGANDYITKPFGTEELLARIRAVLRSQRHNKENAPSGKFQLQDLLIDYDKRQVFVGKAEIDLTQTEYNHSRGKGADVCCHHSCNLGIFGLWKHQEAASQHEEYPKENGRNPR